MDQGVKTSWSAVQTEYTVGTNMQLFEDVDLFRHNLQGNLVYWQT